MALGEVQLVLGVVGELSGQGLAQRDRETLFLLRLLGPAREEQQPSQAAARLGERLVVLGRVLRLARQLREEFDGPPVGRFGLRMLPQLVLDLAHALLGLRRLEQDRRVVTFFRGQPLIEGQGLFQELLLYDR